MGSVMALSGCAYTHITDELGGSIPPQATNYKLNTNVFG